ncbi:MAG: sigma-70 family RNA polymerase sigma factor [Bacteroidales bacterium]|nr:sigma-70 family RNA polymerase sigma factor [Bacteroidales bacterium]
MRLKVLSEDELIQEALNGSEAHLNVLISMYEPFIMDHISKQIKNYQDLLDLRQHICSKIATQISLRNYVHQDKFSNWASTIIKSEINNFFRQKKKSIALHYFSSDVLDEFTDEYLIAAEDQIPQTSNLLHYVEQLSQEQALVIKLKCFKDMTFREISELIGESINTVMGRYRYGIERIREMIER